MSCDTNCADFSLKIKSNLLLVGPTSAGKTFLCAELIRRRDEIFDTKIERIIYSYSEWQEEIFGMMKKYAENIEFVRGLDWDVPEGNRIPTLLLIDDAMELAGSKDKRIERVFCQHTHHRNLFTILILQNMFYPNIQTLARNASYICIFRFVKDGGFINTLARQLNYGKTCPCVVESYRQATSKTRGYLFIDCTNDQDDRYRLRDSIFPDESCAVYMKKGDSVM